MRLAIAKIFAGCIMSALYRSAQIWCGLAGGSDFASDVLVNRFDSNVAGAAFQKTNKLAGSYKLVAVRITAIEHLPSAFRPDNEPIGAWGAFRNQFSCPYLTICRRMAEIVSESTNME